MSAKPYILQIDYQSAHSLFEKFANEPWALLLESVKHKEIVEGINRFSYIAVDPFITLSFKKNLWLCGPKLGQLDVDPFNLLQTLIKTFQLQHTEELPPFQGGMAGYLGYELNHYLENIPYAKSDDHSFPELALGLYDLVISFDHLHNQTWIISSGFPEFDTFKREKRAKQRLEWLLNKINNKSNKINYYTALNQELVNSNFTKKNYIDAINRCKQYILNGDIFEINLSQRFFYNINKNIDKFRIYQASRLINPAPMSAFLNLGEIAIISASPETFLTVSNQNVITRPIKGTAARHIDEQKDKEAASKLNESEKDRAENVMIVDLMRNDLSKVCQNYSVVVEKLCQLESYQFVHHLVSVVKGKLQKDKDIIDLIRATFPGGSITGAPKIRTMQIIAELEHHTRGPYCGSIGFLGFNGYSNLSIAIRTLCIDKKMITFHAGGAITLDSNAEQEYQETLDKAYGTIKTLNNELIYDTVN